jgi:TonB family protein
MWSTCLLKWKLCWGIVGLLRAVSTETRTTEEICLRLTDIQPKIIFGLICAFLAVVTVQLYGEDTAVLAERLRLAGELTSLDAASVRPWHLKLDVQLFDENGKPSEQGTVEEWWASPSLYRVVFTSPSHTGTELRNGDGYYRTAGGGTGGYQLDLMRRQVVHPMPPEDETRTGKLEVKTESFGKVKLECVMVGEEIRGVSYMPYGLFPMYCMDPGESSLRLTYNFGNQVIVRNKMGKFLEKIVSTEVTANTGGKTSASAKVTALQTMPLTAADFVPGSDLEKLGEGPTQVAAGVMAGYKIKGPNPVYPAAAKQNHVSGTVVMRAMIGRDGLIHRLKLVSYPDGDLAISALAAVRLWAYKPYMLNGETTEVDTPITVHYNFGP